LSAHECIQNVIATSENFARPIFPAVIDATNEATGGGSGLFVAGVTSKFAQIFFRDDNDLTGKRRRDLKNTYVTGIFRVGINLKKRHYLWHPNRSR
jgi:hypothetical protein